MAANMRKRNSLILVGALLLALIVVSRFSGRNAKAENSGETLRPAAIVLAKRGPLVNSLTLSGAFRPYQQVVDVHAKVAGYIPKIYVDVGDQVKAGQVLAILEVPELSAEVAGARADIRRSEDAIHRAQSEIHRAESAYSAYHSAYTRLKQASDARPGCQHGV